MNKKTGENSIVVLDNTCFYPNAGGQENDVGTLKIDGEEYKVIYAEKSARPFFTPSTVLFPRPPSPTPA